VQLCRDGADLLNGHMRGLERSLDTALQRSDIDAVKQALDPLVHIASVLVRRAAIESGTNGATAFAEVRKRCCQGFAEQYSNLETLVSTVIDGGVPDVLVCDPALLAAAAQEVGTAAIHVIADVTGDHPLKVVGELPRLIKRQDSSVQLADRAGAVATLAAYASDPAMCVCRKETAETVWRLTDIVGNELFNASVSLHEAGAAEAAFAYNGTSRVCKAATSLAAGVLALTSIGNHYPAWALLRQVVECEYLLWKFSTEPSTIPVWMRSDWKERESNWKPARLYSQDTNDYRRKDYTQHCEQGGHPTPDGALYAGHVPEPDTNAAFMAHGYTHLLLHLHRVYEYAVACADTLDIAHYLPTTVSAEIRDEYRSAAERYLKTDKFAPATSHFSDPTPL